MLFILVLTPGLAVAARQLLLAERASFLKDNLLTQEPTRRTEARLTHSLVAPHRPYGKQSAEAHELKLKARVRLEGLEDDRALATAHLVHSQWAQARSILEPRIREAANAPAADDLSDLAVVELQEGSFTTALSLLDHALEQEPRHPQALWNRALVLKKLELPWLAARVYDEMAALGEPGWSEEARDQAVLLRQGIDDRKKLWTGISNALSTPGGLDGLIASPELAAQLPGTARVVFYKAIRSSTRRDEVERLLPLARVLDKHQGDDALESYVRQVARSDFQQRAPWAREYALLSQGEHPDPEELLGKLARTSERDIYLGALLTLRVPAEHLGNFRALISGSSDPWLRMAQVKYACPEDEAEAIERLQSAHESCDARRFAYRCLGLAEALTDLYIDSGKLADARALVNQSLALARSAGELDFERTFLQHLGGVEMSRYDRPLARAYLREALEQDPSQCSFVHERLANLAMLDFKTQVARDEMNEALQCGQPLTDLGAFLLSELARFGVSRSQQEQFHRILDELRDSSLSPEDEAWLLFVEGQFELEVDRQRGRRRLRDAVAAAERLQDPEDVRHVRDHAYSSLVLDAGRTGEGDEVLELVAESRRIPKPQNCVVVVEDDHTRLMTLVLGPWPYAQPRVRFQENRRGTIGTGGELLSKEDIEALWGCQQVHVLGSNSVLGNAELLPMELAWSYQLPREDRYSPQPGERLVVRNVEPPPALNLPRLPVQDSPLDSSQVELSGSDATPAEVLAKLPRASVIEIHAHGVDQPDLYDSPFIALTPDSQGQYALEEEMIRQQKLERAPVVFLAACGTARRHPLSHKPPSGLPTAFIDAGASAVLAATREVPDSIGEFFDEVGELVRGGTPPAEALQQVRTEWLKAAERARQAGSSQGRHGLCTQGLPQECWLNHVLIYE